MEPIEKALFIRPAIIEDVPLILSFIKELAEYEKLSDSVTANEELLKKTLFGENVNVFALLAFYNEEPAAFAVYFYNYSTFVGKPGLYLEDLFVKPHLRKAGIGKKMLAELAKLAVQKDCGRFEWSVLDWNTPAINFYKSLGATPMDEWTIFRLEGKALKELAEL